MISNKKKICVAIISALSMQKPRKKRTGYGLGGIFLKRGMSSCINSLNEIRIFTPKGFQNYE